MISEAVVKAMTDQVEHEFFSAYLYLAMAEYFESENLSGFAQWMRIQSKEELEHGMKFFDYLIDRGARVSLHAIAQPQATWQSPLDVFEKAYEHEQKVTSLINTIYGIAVKEKDYASQVMLHWFIDEQVEEEKNTSEIASKLRVAGENKGVLFNIDHHIGKRED
jgi:ferritin